MDDRTKQVALAERIASTAAALGIETVVIGAFALAAHGFVRASLDIDLATVVPLYQLRRLQEAIEAAGFSTKLNLPDEQDPLGGKLVVWERVDEDGDPLDAADVVNFLNPHSPRETPATAAIKHALAVAPDHVLRYPRLEHLIALKLDAGGPRDHADVLDLLAANPDADRELIRATCKQYGLDAIDGLLDG